MQQTAAAAAVARVVIVANKGKRKTGLRQSPRHIQHVSTRHTERRVEVNYHIKHSINQKVSYEIQPIGSIRQTSTFNPTDYNWHELNRDLRT